MDLQRPFFPPREHGLCKFVLIDPLLDGADQRRRGGVGRCSGIQRHWTGWLVQRCTGKPCTPFCHFYTFLCLAWERAEGGKGERATCPRSGVCMLATGLFSPSRSPFSTMIKQDVPTQSLYSVPAAQSPRNKTPRAYLSAPFRELGQLLQRCVELRLALLQAQGCALQRVESVESPLGRASKHCDALTSACKWLCVPRRSSTSGG